MLLPIILLGLLAAITVYRLCQTAFKPGLRTIPGPWIAKFTDGWRLWNCRKGLGNVVLPELVKKYGNVIRIGPNMVYVSEQGIFEKVMGHRANFAKSDAIKVAQGVRKGRVLESIATTQDRDIHAALRRPVAGIYSNSNVMQFEPHVHATNQYLLKRLDTEFIGTGCACDIDNWVQYYAFDIVGELTISKRLGFLEQGRDVDGMLHHLNKDFTYFGWVQHMPWLDKLWRKNPLYMSLVKPTQRFMQHAMTLTYERRAELRKNEKAASNETTEKKVDFLHRFLEIQPKTPIVTEEILNGYIATNFVAGSDTTAVTMRAIIYYVLKTPHVLPALRKELDAVLSTSSDYPVSYSTVTSGKLPYLQAVIWEAMRVHPIGVTLFERKLPAEGLMLDSGLKLPANTVVGISPYGTNFEGSCYDDGKYNVREYSPERWLPYEGEGDEVYQKRLAVLRKNDVSFSLGPRSCLGRWIAVMEIAVIIPTIFGLLDLTFVDPTKPWTVKGNTFARQYDMDVYIKWRNGVDKALYL